MPVIVDDFAWRQSDDFVIVTVPLHNRSPNKVDLFTSSKYIKAHFPPYLFEAALLEEIIDEKSKCLLGEGKIVFELAKRDHGVCWASLTKELTKQELIRLKEEAIADGHRKSEKLSEQKAIEKSERQRACVSKHLALEEKARKDIARKKETLKTQAVDDILKWKSTETDDDKTLLPLWKKLGAKSSENETEQAKPDELAIFEEAKTNQEVGKPSAETKNWKPKKPIPPTAPLRSFVRIKCDFTHRSFPTPMRESKFTEEEEWLSKQAEARRKTGFVAEDLRPEENNPEWLLEKGRSFHEVGNYLGAVSAYSHAIGAWDKIPELYAARAASQICLKNWRRTIFDATECLDLCQPKIPTNADLRFYSHLYRGQALLEVGKGKAAMADFVEALELRPDYGKLEHFMDRAESAIAEQEAIEAKETMKRLITSTDGKEAKVETKYLSPADLAD
ncbi:dyslexia susceptibility 1 candidate 1 [Nesidiocoris tenuis]|uniref:Dyslexia susceptibility 1 candidate 1 n=1 Tax=Nesidiocoris tenuis TaxID=355587 RepID=A0ABN7BEZ0_9HEMI|nr:dyslexia susceptibility 1 candidate 1 [Nesidiocoris tenuis]